MSNRKVPVMLTFQIPSSLIATRPVRIISRLSATLLILSLFLRCRLFSTFAFFVNCCSGNRSTSHPQGPHSISETWQQFSLSDWLPSVQRMAKPEISLSPKCTKNWLSFLPPGSTGGCFERGQDARRMLHLCEKKRGSCSVAAGDSWHQHQSSQWRHQGDHWRGWPLTRVTTDQGDHWPGWPLTRVTEVRRVGGESWFAHWPFLASASK